MRKFLLLVMALACGVAASAYTYRVMINAENFPDANFRAYLQSMPWGANGYVDDPFTITVMDCSGRDISSLVGIEFFNMLKELDCSNNNLTELPDNENGTFGQTMGELQSLRCDGNAFKTLNLPDLRATVVNVSSCLELESLVLPGSKVSELYCYNNPKLKNLSLPCEGMAGALTRLNCSEGSLTWLDLSAFGKLEYLDCSDNDLTLLTVSDASPLSELRINRNNIKGKAMDTMIGSLPARPSPTQFRAMYNADGNVMTTAQVAAAKAKKWVPMFSNGPSWVEYAGTKPVAPPYGTLEPYLIEVTGNTLSDFGNEGYHKMFDGDLMTQWRVVHPGDNWQTVSVEFMSKKPFIPTAYTFYTAKDTYSHPNRNPKQWTLYGKKELDDDWTVLSGAQGDWLGAANLAEYKFPIDNHGECRFFRLEVNNVGDAEDGNFIMQLAEFDMEGLPGSGGTETDPSRFDINGDGNADVGDVNAVLAAILDADNSEAFDVNGDGNVDVGDVNAVLECILNGGIADNKVTVTVGDVSFKMVPVKGGLFLMGSTQGSAYNRSDEEPVHLVSLSDYWLGETEVTEGLWKAVMGSVPELSSAKGDNYPVEGAFMYEIDEFISRLNQMTGLTFALPTEAQWEFAARGGRLSRGYVYAGSDNIDDVAWYRDNSGRVKHEVATKRPNELGLYDMTGNLREWCSDGYGEYGMAVATDPAGPSSEETHVMRGGTYVDDAGNSRTTARQYSFTSNSGSVYGLRLMLKDVEPGADPNTFTVGDVTFKMVNVWGGTFEMGATPDQGFQMTAEKPVHTVTVSDFQIAETEVTEGLWKAVMDNLPGSLSLGDNYPVENVSWMACQVFITKLNELTGEKFRLPTEAEWEFAARGGAQAQPTRYAGNDDLEAVGWYEDNSGYLKNPVGQKSPNELGLYDMSGNVFEWCQDGFSMYTSAPQTDPVGPDSDDHIIRGGSYTSMPAMCRVCYRTSSGSGGSGIGLRLAK